MTLARFLGSPRKRFLIINVLGDSKASSRVDIKLMDRRELETIYPGMLDRVREAGLLSVAIDLRSMRIVKLWLRNAAEGDAHGA
ncbi:MAG: hypothetical protein GXO32_02150 [Crenarchaeota archaeon]|nr:hypothetical protein [Thermoproteota archaeon]